MKIAYVAGPYRAPDTWARERNIRAAEILAFELWKAGFAVVCPHTNTRYFDGALQDEVFLRGDQLILLRCDCVVTVTGWENSRGSIAEVALAHEWRMPVLHSLRSAKRWLENAEAK